MAPTTEAGLVRQIRKAVLEQWPSAWQVKTVGNPYQISGLPDLLFCVEGLLVGIEVKFRHPGEAYDHAVERVSPQQRNQIRAINRAGGIAGVAMSPTEALDLIRRGLDRHERRKREGS